MGKYHGDAYLDNLVRIADFRTVERLGNTGSNSLPSEFFMMGKLIAHLTTESRRHEQKGGTKWEDEMNENVQWYLSWYEPDKLTIIGNK